MAIDKKAEKERLFIEAYLSNGLNATKAYVTAGYAKTTDKWVRQKASEFITKGDIKDEILQRLRDQLFEKEGLTNQVIQELIRLAFSDIRDVTKWTDNGLQVIPSDELTDEAARTITEISETKAGIKIKQFSKEKAVEMLGKYLDLLKEKHVVEVKEYKIEEPDDLKD